jgi:hypothetical protein
VKKGRGGSGNEEKHLLVDEDVNMEDATLGKSDSA